MAADDHPPPCLGMVVADLWLPVASSMYLQQLTFQHVYFVI